MREIKLRFWDKENNCMVYQDKNGLYPNSFYKIECDLFTSFKFKLFRLSKLNQFSEALNRFEEVESVKMQCTGVEDKNGTEIYEGDVVQTKRASNIRGYVTMYKGSWCIYNGHKYYRLYHNFPELVSPIEIIGNIYENLELMEDVK